MLFPITTLRRVADAEQIGTVDFSDLTAAKVTGVSHYVTGGVDIPFTPTPSANEQQRIAWRLQTRDINEENIVVAAYGALAELANIRDFVGVATTTQLTAAVKTLANIEVGLIQILLRQIAGG